MEGWLAGRGPGAGAFPGDVRDAILEATDILISAFESGGKVLVAGNGGSAAEAQHLASELVGRFAEDRPGLPAVALTCDTSALTAIANDYGFEAVFSRQVEALGRSGDVLVLFSTSGTSPNVVRAAAAAAAADMRIILIVGRRPGPLTAVADVTIACPGVDTASVQECHLSVVHTLCQLLDASLFGHELPPSWRPGVTSLPELVALRVRWREAGLRVVSTNGCFDLLHAGHLHLLEESAQRGDVLVVGINGDDSVRRLKGGERPLVPLADRMRLVAALGPVWAVVAFDEDTPVELLGALAPDVHCKGADYGDATALPEHATVVTGGGRVELVPVLADRSTSSMVERMRTEVR
jgi:phosphoheptose isomerase